MIEQETEIRTPKWEWEVIVEGGEQKRSRTVQRSKPANSSVQGEAIRKLIGNPDSSRGTNPAKKKKSGYKLLCKMVYS